MNRSRSKIASKIDDRHGSTREPSAHSLGEQHRLGCDEAIAAPLEDHRMRLVKVKNRLKE
jgi:hypothetical protein